MDAFDYQKTHAAAAKSLQSCPTLCNPRDGSLPGSSVSPHQSESESKVTQSCPTVCDPWTVAHQASPSMGFSRQEYWSGLPFPSPGDLLDPGIEPRSPALQVDSLPTEPQRKPYQEDNTITVHLESPLKKQLSETMLLLNLLNKYLLMVFIFGENINFLCKTHEHTYHSLVKLEKRLDSNRLVAVFILWIRELWFVFFILYFKIIYLCYYLIKLYFFYYFLS